VVWYALYRKKPKCVVRIHEHFISYNISEIFCTGSFILKLFFLNVIYSCLILFARYNNKYIFFKLNYVYLWPLFGQHKSSINFNQTCLPLYWKFTYFGTKIIININFHLGSLSERYNEKLLKECKYNETI